MKRKILTALVVLAGLSGAAHANEPFHFGIGLCSYSYSERTGSLLVDVKGGSSAYCTSDVNMAKAAKAYANYAALPQVEHVEHDVPAADYNGAVETYKRCMRVVAAPRLCVNYVMGY